MIPQPQSVSASGGSVEIQDRRLLDTRIDNSLSTEAYKLEIKQGGKIVITGGSEAGVFYGQQTLRQLLPAASLRQSSPAGPWKLPVLEISDEPQFRWRGVMIDVARHFMPISDVLRFIDLAAFHKLNTVHIHLTEDQGWRFEVPDWPRLTSVGAWRKRSMLGSTNHDLYDSRPHGGFYSTDDLREMVAFASARHVTLVPEIDMPGHMQAAVAAYPSLGNGIAEHEVGVREAWGISKHVLNMDDGALDFCRTVLDTVCDIFPSEVIGIGGDECPHDEWRANPQVQQRMKDLGLKDENALHGWFVGQMSDHLRSKQPPRRTFGWDEILAAKEGLPGNTLIAAWRGAEPTSIAARRGFDVVACPDTSCYLDYRQSEHVDEPTPVGTVLTVQDVYSFDPVPSDLSEDKQAQSHVIGAQCNVWTEHMESARRVDYMTYPRLCAFAEVAWGKRLRGEITRGDVGFDDFERRLEEHVKRLDALGVNYRPLTGPRPWDARPDAPGRPRTKEQRLQRNKTLIENIR